MRTGSAIANGVRQYAVSVTNAQWFQLEARPSAGVTPNLVAASGLAAGMPVIRWGGQAGTGTDPATGERGIYDYVQGILIQNTHPTLTLYLTTTLDQTGAAPAAGERAVANCIAIAPTDSIRLDNTDASKIYLRASGAGPIIAAVLAT